MSILLVSGDFSVLGGMDRANYELARYLADDLNNRVALVAHHVAEPLASHPNIRWRRVPKPLSSYTFGEPFLKYGGHSAGRMVAAKLGRIVVNGANCPWPDINWVHWVECNWKPRLDYAPAHVKLRTWLSRRHVLGAERSALGMARIIVANSERTRCEIIQTFGISPDRVCRIYLGTDPEAFRPATPIERLAAREQLGWPNYVPTAIFIGALGYDRRKGFDVLFEAWQQLCSDPAWDVDLVAAGGGAEVSYWKARVQKLGLERRIRLMGFTRATAQLLRAADLLIHPAFYEPYGLGVHEALCCAVPALVTRSSGVAERYPAALSDFLLESPPSVRNLVDRLRQWRAQHDAWRARVGGFSAKLRQRTWADMAREFVELTMPSLIAGEVPAAIL